MEKGKLLEAISAIRQAWEAAIAELGRAGLERPGVDGERRVRDVLAIFNGWERWNLVQLRCAFSGEIPTPEELTGGIPYPAVESFDIDVMNEMYVAATRELPTAEILRHWRKVSAMRAAWVSAATQAMLDQVVGADWSSQTNRLIRLAAEVPSVSNPMTAGELICDQVDLQKSHLQSVREWMER
jgi:hypothetical protein